MNARMAVVAEIGFTPFLFRDYADEALHVRITYVICISDYRVKDNCIVAEDNGHVVGAVWTRIMDDYGHVDNDTPSFAISLYKEYRGHGIGTRLMQEMLGLLKEQGYKRASLAVQKANYAVRMYEKIGFKTIDENDEEYIMVCKL